MLCQNILQSDRNKNSIEQEHKYKFIDNGIESCCSTDLWQLCWDAERIVLSVNGLREQEKHIQNHKIDYHSTPYTKWIEQLNVRY